MSRPSPAAALVLALLLTACAEKEPKQTGKNVADEMEAIRNAMCECKTEACADDVMVRYQGFLSANQYALGDKYAARRVERLAGELASCERRTKLAKIAKTPPVAPGFPVDRSDPPITLDKLAATWKPAGPDSTDEQVVEVSFDATVNKIMANSHTLKVHARCTGLDKPRTYEASLTGEQLGGTTAGNLTSTAVTLFKSKPLAARPESCTISFRVSGSPSDFERVCVRGAEISPRDCSGDEVAPAP